MSDLAGALRDRVDAELEDAPAEICGDFVAEIRRRHGDAVAAVLFYGSCLRRDTDEGVLDFYALVDDYDRAYASRGLAWANAALPPNVFYLECGPRRAKVALISVADFLHAAGPQARRPLVWARFSQPFAAAWLRDEAARRDVVSGAARALATAVERGVGLLPTNADRAACDAESFWNGLFRETYASELRPERDASVQQLFARHRARYHEVLERGLEALAAEGRLAYERAGDGFVLRDAPELLRRPRHGRRQLARALSVAALLKSAFTFGDWLPYALWKIERHTGTRLEPTERQRRHPLLFAWPLVFKALARRDLR